MSCVAMHLHADHNNKLIDFRDENDNCDENCEVNDEVMAKEDLLLRSVICTPSLLFAPHLLLRSVICTPPSPQGCYLHRHRSAPHGPSQSMLPGDDQH